MRLAGLSGWLAQLGETIFILHSYAIVYLTSIKMFVVTLEKDCLVTKFASGLKFLCIFWNKQ